MKLKISFPQTVEYKSCTATIYLQKNASKERFEVRYYDLDGSMQRLSFATHAMAIKFADTTVRARQLVLLWMRSVASGNRNDAPNAGKGSFANWREFFCVIRGAWILAEATNALTFHP